MKEAIIIFTRVPVPGQTKTRLMPCFTEKECAKLHICFLSDIWNQCKETKRDIFLYYTPEGKGDVLRTILGTKSDLYVQQGNSLGERMLHSITEVLKKGYDSCVLIGTDIPEIKSDYLRQAFQKLKQVDVVLGPTMDQGYYLIGMKKPISLAFSDQTYGTGTVLENTIQKLRVGGYRTACIQCVADIDEAKDLLVYRKNMENDIQLLNNTTGRYLQKHHKISVIVPLFNEESTILQMQKELEKMPGCEILFVDGGSTDRTLELIHPKYQIIHSEKGRANQMNAGAKASNGDVLFFLHCDSELPEHPVTEIHKVIKEHRWGCFGIAFHSRNIFLFTCRVLSNHRAKRKKIVFGDQGIFIERNLFFEVGMFKNIPIMEDYQFSLTLKERKERIGIAKHRIYTSHRRFKGNNIKKLKILWQMNRLQKMFREGEDIKVIANLYQDVR